MSAPKGIDPWRVRVLLRKHEPKEVALLIGCRKELIYRIIKKHDIPFYYRPGRRTDLLSVDALAP